MYQQLAAGERVILTLRGSTQHVLKSTLQTQHQGKAGKNSKNLAEHPLYLQPFKATQIFRVKCPKTCEISGR